jgi:hypothetical protein
MKYIIDTVIVVDAPNERAARNYIDLILRVKAYVKEYSIVHIEYQEGKP